MLWRQGPWGEQLVCRDEVIQMWKSQRLPHLNDLIPVSFLHFRTLFLLFGVCGCSCELWCPFEGFL